MTGPNEAKRIRKLAGNGEIVPDALLSDIDAPGQIPLASAIGPDLSAMTLACDARTDPFSTRARRVYGHAWCQAGTRGLAWRSNGNAIMGQRGNDGYHGVPAGFSTSFRRNLPLLMQFTPIVTFAQLPNRRRSGDDSARTRVMFTRQPDDRQFQASVSRDFGNATVDTPMENRANA